MDWRTRFTTEVDEISNVEMITSLFHLGFSIK